MRLVREYDIAAQELPYIEQSRVANYTLRSHLNSSFSMFDHIDNLNEFLDNGSTTFSQDSVFNINSPACERLIERVNNGSVLLVHERDSPFAPIVRFIPTSDGQAEGEWRIDSLSSGGHDLSPYITDLIESLPNSRDISSSSGVSAKHNERQPTNPEVREHNPETTISDNIVTNTILSPRSLSLQLLDTTGIPYENTAYVLHIDNHQWQGTTDNNGIIEQKVPTQKTKANLHIWPDKNNPKDLIILEIDI